MLAESGECQCGNIVDRLPLAKATVSQHLKVLKDAGLIHADSQFPVSLTLVTAVVLLAIGVGAIVSMLFQVGPFG